MKRRALADIFRDYLLAFAITALAMVVRGSLSPWIGNRFPYFTYVLAIAASGWFCGLGPGLMSLTIAIAAARAMMLGDPDNTGWEWPSEVVGVVVFTMTGLGILALAARARVAQSSAARAVSEAEGQRELLRVTLQSIGEAVIATDAQARITFLNGVAERITGWWAAEAEGRPLRAIFRLVDGETREPIEVLMEKVLREGRDGGLEHHALLIDREGMERPIQNCVSPIRDARGVMLGVVLVFRDVSAQRAAQRALVASESSYRTLAEGLDLMVGALEPDGRVAYLNQKWREYTGLAEFDSRHIGWDQAVHPGDVSSVRAKLARGFTEGEAVELECRIRRASDGAYRWHLLRIGPIRDAEGRVVRWHATALDIEDRRLSIDALMAKEERLRIAFEIGRLGTWDYDVPNGLVTWSPSLEGLHGLAPGTFPGTFEAYKRDIHTEDRERVLGSIGRSIETGEEHHQEYRLVWPDGSIHWIDARGKPITDASGQIVRMLGVCVDVTERKRHEAELRRALDLAEEAGRARDRFLAMLSHELRTPLTPVLLATGEMRSDPALTDQQRDQLSTIRQYVELEIRLIDDLLDVMRILRGKLPLRLEATDLHELIAKTIEICRNDAQEKALDLSAQTEATGSIVRADPARLQQVLWNLVKNAVKFTPEGGAVRVQTRDGEKGKILVEVTDNGIGIDPSALSRIFHAFEQGEDDVTSKFGGLGLGLAISKSIVEMHGGVLTATSEGRGRGATLSFALLTQSNVSTAPDPSATVGPEQPASSRNGSTPDLSGLRILLVEDDPMTARIMARLLRRNGFTVVTANTMTSALEVSPHEIDLVVSDIGLPDGNGLDLMRQIRQRTDVPGIALTGFGREDDVRKSLEAGFVAHLTKPIDFDRLDELIRQVMHDPQHQMSDGGGGLAV
jgi:PAS domain S-box-containing protein